jgi:hypothetical protein
MLPRPDDLINCTTRGPADLGAGLATTDANGFEMNRATHHMRSIAQRLIAYEAPGDGSPETTEDATFRVTERLRPHLATLMGNGGFRALLARALVLAAEEVPSLRTVRISPDGTLAGFELSHARLKPAEICEGRVVLLAQLLGLLVAFIGPGMTSRLVGEIWPQSANDKVDFGDGDKK